MDFADIRPGDFVHVRLPVTDSDSETVVVKFHAAEFLIERQRIVGHEEAIQIGAEVEVPTTGDGLVRGTLLALHDVYAWVNVTEPNIGPQIYRLDDSTFMRRPPADSRDRASEAHS